MFTLRLEKAVRLAALAHRQQGRKLGDTPYVSHLTGVALILQQAGWGEDVVIAGLLHDVVEDTEVTLEQVREQFGSEVAGTVSGCSEVKLNSKGKKLPWMQRKREHLQRLATSTTSVGAVVLADRLQNLTSILFDLRAGAQVWPIFNAPREDVLWYYKASIEAVAQHHPSLQPLVAACLQRLQQVSEFAAPAPQPG